MAVLMITLIIILIVYILLELRGHRHSNITLH